MTSPGPFEEHAKQVVARYSKERSQYARLAKEVSLVLNVIRDEIRQENAIPMQSLTGGTKNPDKVQMKAALAHPEDPRRLRFPEPFSGDPKTGIPDFARARVVAFYLDDIDLFDKLMPRHLESIARVDKWAQLQDQGRFGYRAVHHQVRLLTSAAARKEFPDHMTVEVQLHTVLTSAWAELEHGFYDSRKYQTSDDAALTRRFQILAATLELSDTEFAGLDRDRRGPGAS